MQHFTNFRHLQRWTENAAKKPLTEMPVGVAETEGAEKAPSVMSCTEVHSLDVPTVSEKARL